MYMEPEFNIFEQSKPLWRKKNHEKALEINTVHSRKLQPPPIPCLKQSIPLSNWCTIVSGIEGEIIKVKGKKRVQFSHYFILLSFKWYFGEIRNCKATLSQKTYKLYIPALHNWLTYRPTGTHKCVFHMHPHLYRLAALATSSLI